MAALGASGTAGQPWTGAPGSVRQGGVNNLDKPGVGGLQLLGLVRGQSHPPG
jgi:hypothetical protein